MRHTPFSAKHLDATGKLLTSVGGSLGYVATEVWNQKGMANLAIAGQSGGVTCSLLIIRGIIEC
jgi:hypothetical protein